MRATEAPAIREYYIDIMRKRLDALPRTLDPGVAHLSELELCPVKPHYARTLEEQPALSDESVLQFMRGRGLEFFLSKELPVKEKDGLCGTVDDSHNMELVEIKSTASDLGRFSIASIYPWWLQRTKGYCVLHGTDTINLVVWFLTGDIFTTKKVRTDLRAWTLTFSQEELDKNWEYLKSERAKMFAHIDHGELPDAVWVKSRRKYFECPGCRYSLVCPHFSGGL